MVNDIQVKVCGIRSLTDALAASTAGADYLGFNLDPQSPRYLSLEMFKQFLPNLPSVKKVGVLVYSSPDDLEKVKDVGFDFVQIHFPNETSFIEVAMWTDIIPPQRLWLAPRMRPGKELDLAFVPLADTFLLDTYRPNTPEKSGDTGDWAVQAWLSEKFVKASWVVSGGLDDSNVAAAVTASKARIVNVNEGVESSPGIKDPAKLNAFFEALKHTHR